MKIGDIVMSTKIRPYENAKITKADIQVRFNEKKQRNETRTTYVAEFPDKTTFTFYGFNVNKSVFKVQEADGQMCLEDFMNYPEEDE